MILLHKLWFGVDSVSWAFVGLAAAAVALLVVPLVPSGLPVLVAGSVALLAGVLHGRRAPA